MYVFKHRCNYRKGNDRSFAARHYAAVGGVGKLIHFEYEFKFFLLLPSVDVAS